MQDQVLTNQTQFAAEEPILEQPEQIADSEPAAKKNNKKSKKNKKLIILIITLGIIILFLLILLVLVGNKKQNPSIKSEPSPSPETNQNINPLHQQVLDLQAELETVDPTIDQFPFPPVDLELRLDNK